MADAVTTQVIFQGDKQVVLKFTNVSDGTGESAVTKVDVATLAPYQKQACIAVQIDRIYAMTSGMDVRMLWDATTDQVILTVPSNIAQTFDFDNWGGINNNAGAGSNGNILFTTVGATAGDSYSIILYLRKLY
jgi:hypothetical protein